MALGPEVHPEAEVLDSHPAPVAGKLSVSIVTPLGSVLARDVDEVVAPGSDGELGVLPGHVPFLTTLRPGVLVVRTGNERQVLAVGAGYLQVGAEGRTQVLVDQAAWPADIDVAAVRAEKAKLEEQLKGLVDSPDAGAFASVNAKIDWAQARLDAASR